MFDETQINSYKCITAPADLRQRVLTACENQTTVRKFPTGQALYRLAPLVACLVLIVSVFALNRNDSLMLYAGDMQLANTNQVLSPITETGSAAEPVSYGIRTCSLEPAQYTITLTGNQDMEILSVDGIAALDETGNITWAVYIPTKDMVFELFLSTGEDTYYVPLQYHAQDGCFSIRYEKQ